MASPTSACCARAQLAVSGSSQLCAGRPRSCTHPPLSNFSLVKHVRERSWAKWFSCGLHWYQGFFAE